MKCLDGCAMQFPVNVIKDVIGPHSCEFRVPACRLLHQVLLRVGSSQCSLDIYVKLLGNKSSLVEEDGLGARMQDGNSPGCIVDWH